MNIFNRGNQTPRHKFIIGALALLPAAGLLYVTSAFAQTAPVLTIARLGTNIYSITVTNNVGTNGLDLYHAALFSAAAAHAGRDLTNGVPGQTNFIYTSGAILTEFFYVATDTNAIPLWERADQGNPAAGVLAVFIDSPTNGANITQ